MDGDTKRSVLLPFNGFYESIHSQALDFMVESTFSDENGEANHGLLEHVWHILNWRAAHKVYAADYAECVGKHVNVPIEFDLLSSPREYNFTTDRVFGNIEHQHLQRIARETPPDVMKSHAKRMFTSCSGFCSHYRNTVEEWDGFDDWDHNQLGCLLAAFIDHTQDGDHELREFQCDYSSEIHSNCWNDLENALYPDTEEMQRIWKIHDYLREREERRSPPYGVTGYLLARIGSTFIVKWPQYDVLPYRLLRHGEIIFTATSLARAWRYAVTH